MAAEDGSQLPATIAASRSVEKALEEAASSGALNLSNRKLKEFPRTARNYDLSDITHADLPGGHDALPAAELDACVPCHQRDHP
ncbi:leucine-rich repeat and calponin homology domain-containing protein 4-like [Conger conger]|uniref:leucine-rich repeat and calponin homology domain-containing protein 4-like n=1 Tax=Conger conger TaxID=82655 RepID=UPI002A5A1ABC|nr:leucine-rich repeat and calponin homology domain-containing protein 4-like [Conger conger]